MSTAQIIIPKQGRQGFEVFFGLASSLIALSLGILYSASYSNIDTSRSNILSSLSIGIGTIGLILLITAEGLSRPPRDGPHEYLKRRKGDERNCLVCLGDSLTHGACSANWVASLPNRLQTDSKTARTLKVVNAGQNSICTHTVLKEKVDHVVACQPDYIVIMIGSNDAMAIYREDWARNKMHIWNLPERPTEDLLILNLRGIVEAFLERTSAAIAIATLPPFGEVVDSASNKIIDSINNRIKSLEYLFLGEVKNDSRDTPRVSVIDVNKALWTEINKSRRSNNSNTTHSIDEFLPYAMIMGMLHCVLGISWNSLTRLFTGNAVLSESLHLNEKGGNVVRNLVVKWLMEKMT